MTSSPGLEARVLSAKQCGSSASECDMSRPVLLYKIFQFLASVIGHYAGAIDRELRIENIAFRQTILQAAPCHANSHVA